MIVAGVDETPICPAAESRRQRMRVLRNAFLGGMLMMIGTGAMAQAQVGNARSVASQPRATKTISIGTVKGKFAFLTATATVKAGTRVIWSNKTAAPHTATSNRAGVFDVSIAPGKSKSVVLKKVGTFLYICSIHPYMKGRLVVTK
jgi:plastocyanin